MTNETLNALNVKDIFNYNPESGIFTWKTIHCQKIRIGAEAGSLNKTHGYIFIKYKGKRHPAHRIAWLYMHGNWPINNIDHINGNGKDNRIVNLREATQSQNLQNKRAPQSNNTSGYLGVSLHKLTGKFMAQIRTKGKVTYLGLYEKAEDAHQEYLKEKRKRHDFCTI